MKYLLFVAVWFGGAMTHDFDIVRECGNKGSKKLFIYKTSITCTVNVEK